MLLEKPDIKISGQGAHTQQSFFNSLNDDREVYLAGKRVNVLEHTAFQGILHELGRVYQLQHAAPFSEQMLCPSQISQVKQSRSYQCPFNFDDLHKKKSNTDLWMTETWGQLPRVPDFMSNIIVGLYDFRNRLGELNPTFYKNVINYYHYCAENDISLTHAIGDPQIDRSITLVDDADLALRIIKERDDGIIVRGAKQLATLAPVSNEVFVYLSPSFAMREKKEFVIWFAIPIATPGLKVLCREPHSVHNQGHAHHFSQRYDEQDAMLFFDDVLVPWERVFLMHDSKLAFEGFFRINAWALYTNTIRFHHRLRTFIAIGKMMSRFIGVYHFRPTKEKLGELVTYAEMIRLTISGMGSEAKLTDGGLLAPSDATAPGVFAAQISSRVIEIVKEIGASGLVMQPSEEDLLHPDLAPFLTKYMRGHNVSVQMKSRLFKLAWDLVGDSYGMRQDLYEKWNRGDVVRNRISLLENYDTSDLDERIEKLIKSPLKTTGYFNPAGSQVSSSDELLSSSWSDEDKAEIRSNTAVDFLGSGPRAALEDSK